MKKLLTEDEAAELLGCSKSTLARHRGTKNGPPFRKIGALIRYHPDSLEEWSRTPQEEPQGNRKAPKNLAVPQGRVTRSVNRLGGRADQPRRRSASDPGWSPKPNPS